MNMSVYDDPNGSQVWDVTRIGVAVIKVINVGWVAADDVAIDVLPDGELQDVRAREPHQLDVLSKPSGEQTSLRDPLSQAKPGGEIEIDVHYGDEVFAHANSYTSAREERFPTGIILRSRYSVTRAAVHVSCRNCISTQAQ